MLKIVDLQGHLLASLKTGAGSILELQVADEQFRAPLETWFSQLGSQKVHLIGGTEQERNGKVVRNTRRRVVKPSDDDYLRGIQDMVARQGLKLGGTRVRALITKDGE